MSAASVDLTVEQNATFRQTITWTDNSATPQPIDLSNASGYMSLKQASGTTSVLDLNSTGGGITLGGTAGTIAILITAAQSALLTQPTYKYDLLVKFSNGDVTRVIQGNVIISLGITVAP